MLLRHLLISCLVFLLFLAISPHVFVHGQADKDIWVVYDVIEPTLDQVKWSEQGGIETPPSWIADSSWSYASMRESLVSQNDIFVSLFERFDWSKVRGNAEDYYQVQFSSFDDFVAALRADAGPWLDLSWQMDTHWYGISQNTTKIDISFNQTSNEVELSSWFHITRLAEYLSGSDKITNWLTGFDLTPISVGNMKLWELHEDWASAGIYYNLQFEAPANLLVQHGGNYSCDLAVSNSYAGYKYKIDQSIEINMPADTEVTVAAPESMRAQNEAIPPNTASFMITHDDVYPEAFAVTSSPPTKNVFMEALTAWFTTPAGWAAIASLLVLSATGLRGRKIYSRSRLYHRLYKSMVTLYDLYSKDIARFRTEMENVSKSIFKMMVEDKVSDDQFEKLLKRRDDLLERAEKEQPPPPPRPTGKS